MAPARASNRNRYIRLAFVFILRKKKVDERVGVLEELSGGLMRVHIVHNGWMSSSVRFQIRHEIRIRQKSDIENQIGIDGNAILESETHKRHEQLLGLPFLKQAN